MWKKYLLSCLFPQSLYNFTSSFLTNADFSITPTKKNLDCTFVHVCVCCIQNIIQKAIESSLCAHRDWEKRPLEERAEIFRNAGDLIACKYRNDLLAATMLGQGKTIIQADVDAACELADFYHFNAQWAMVNTAFKMWNIFINLMH